MDISKLIGDANSIISLFTTLGIDALIVFVIIALTYLARSLFKIRGEWTSRFCALGIGAVLAIVQIILSAVPMENWLRVFFGYPLVSCVLYAWARSKWPNFTLFKPEENNNPEASTR
jgi:cell shape-determining protein MreD